DLTRSLTMRNRWAGAIASVVGVVALTVLVAAQNTQNTQNNAPKSPWRYYPADRAVGDGGPAPKRDLSGTWAGPQSGAGVPDLKEEPAPPLTALGKQLYDMNKPLGKWR